MDNVKTVENCKPFRELEAQDIRLLARIAERRHILQGHSVFEEGDNGEEMFIIELGTIQLLTEDEVVASLGTGSLFGELAVVSAAHKRLATATAPEGTYVLALSRAKLEAAAVDDTAFGSRFWLAMARALVRRLNASQHSIARLHRVARRSAGASDPEGGTP